MRRKLNIRCFLHLSGIKKKLKMDYQGLAKQIQQLRKKQGLSQELLAEECGLNLRTIQRIESGSSEPRGDTLKRLAAALNVTPDEIVDWTIIKDDHYLTNLNSSSFSFLLFPLLGILVPLIIWISRKGKVKDLNHTAKEVLNFQISWTIFLFFSFIAYSVFRNYQLKQITFVSPQMLETPLYFYVIFGFLYAINLAFILGNIVRLKSNQKAKYPIKINFIK
jgi:transcriptional regulator with XRE-family HTH domain